MSSYLDKAGLARFWSAIKSYVDAHSGGGNDISQTTVNKYVTLGMTV